MAALDELQILTLGLRPYREVLELQRKLQQDSIYNNGLNYLIICEHPKVITLGRQASHDNILVSQEILAAKGMDVLEIERGGDVTLHAPGQLVCYPILDLNQFKRDVGWFMRSLEEVVIQFLANFGIEGHRIAGKTGVWILQAEHNARKIASMGVRISRWRTLHGFAINLTNDLTDFQLIHPCGMPEVEMTSVQKELPENTEISFNLSSETDQLVVNIVRIFKKVFTSF